MTLHKILGMINNQLLIPGRKWVLGSKELTTDEPTPPRATENSKVTNFAAVTAEGWTGRMVIISKKFNDVR